MSQQELATAANVGLSTVKDYEAGRRTPIGNNLAALRTALEGRGIAFTTNGITGLMYQAHQQVTLNRVPGV